VSEVILAANACKSAVTEAYQTANSSWSPTSNGWGCNEGSGLTKFVSGLATDPNGVITITASNDPDLGGAGNMTITVTPKDSSDASLAWPANAGATVHHWKCTSSSNKYAPGSCK
jgi:type IV pilus assembly protein PilA